MWYTKKSDIFEKLVVIRQAIDYSRVSLLSECLLHAGGDLSGVVDGVEIRKPAAHLAVARAHVHQRAQPRVVRLARTVLQELTHLRL